MVGFWKVQPEKTQRESIKTWKNLTHEPRFCRAYKDDDTSPAEVLSGVSPRQSEGQRQWSQQLDDVSDVVCKYKQE